MKVETIVPDDFTGKNILIAGASGFVPSYVSEFYLKRNANVYGVDNFITGDPDNAERLSKKYSNFYFEKANIYDNLPEFNSVKFDYVFSLASPASPIDFKVIPHEIMMVNSLGTKFLLDLAKRDGARFLEASTSEVYGDPEIHPQVESYYGKVNPIGPRSCYDESKRFAEAMTMTYKRIDKVDTRIVRIFNTYGPRMRPDDGRVIPNFINQALKNEPITIYGDGSQTRSFCFVTDLINAMTLVMHGPESSPVNIGNPDEYTIKTAAEIIVKVLDSQSELKYFPRPEDDPMKRRPDISKIQSFSSYKPEVTFEEGLRQTAEFFKSKL